jgi:hypothetical protein
VTDDVRMQGKGEGNREAAPSFADHSLSLIVSYLLKKGDRSDEQDTSCASIMASLTGPWLKVLDEYKLYKVYLGEAPFSETADMPSRKYRLPGEAGTGDISSWLVFGPENVLEALLEHLALTGEKLVSEKGDEEDDEKEDEEDPVKPVKEELKPQLQKQRNTRISTNESSLQYAKFRAMLEVARGKDGARWTALHERLEKLASKQDAPKRGRKK